MAEEHRKKIHKGTLAQIFDVVKTNFANSNLTIKEVALNSDVSEELLAILFDNSNNIINDLSRLIEFSKTELRYKKTSFISYKMKNSKTSIYKIHRTIKPICTVLYNSATDELSNFWCKSDLNSVDKQLIINEFYEFAQQS